MKFLKYSFKYEMLLIFLIFSIFPTGFCFKTGTSSTIQSKNLISSENKSQIKSKNSNKNNVQADDKDKTPDKVPIINVHMEEADRDPLEVKRIEEERRIERNRIREMETMEEMDKRTFQQIIAMQNSQIAKLSAIADQSTQVLNRLMTKGEEKDKHMDSYMSFKQRDTSYESTFDEGSGNGPINFSRFLQ
jgi:hypothetical protein